MILNLPLRLLLKEWILQLNLKKCKIDLIMRNILIGIFALLPMVVWAQQVISDSTIYYNNGKPREVRTFCEGKLHGLTTEYYENGVVKSLKTFVYDVEVFYIYFYPNAVVHGIFEYKDGKISKHMKFNESGVLGYEEFYEDGVKVGKKYYIKEE